MRFGKEERMTFWEIFWGAVPLAIMFGAGVFMGVTITSVAAAAGRDTRERERMEEDGNVRDKN